MNRRLKLHEELCIALESRNVYYQPPATIKMVYPCIVYELSGVDTLYADDLPYRRVKRYTITVIDKDPDSPILDRIGAFSSCIYNRRFTVDNLYHDVFLVYY